FYYPYIYMGVHKSVILRSANEQGPTVSNSILKTRRN
ncbi:MAG: hypothetical protein ACI8XX_001422, partial [Polaribacter sp.]